MPSFILAIVDHGVAQGDRFTFNAAGLSMPIGVSRFTIPAGASAAQAIAVLDMAAAAESGASVVFAVPDEQLLLALQLWSGEGAANSARLAPISAVIRHQRGG